MHKWNFGLWRQCCTGCQTSLPPWVRGIAKSIISLIQQVNTIPDGGLSTAVSSLREGEPRVITTSIHLAGQDGVQDHKVGGDAREVWNLELKRCQLQFWASELCWFYRQNFEVCWYQRQLIFEITEEGAKEKRSPRNLCNYSFNSYVNHYFMYLRPFMKLNLSQKYDLNGGYRNHQMEKGKVNRSEALQNSPSHSTGILT